jgi:multidrug resistance protein
MPCPRPPRCVVTRVSQNSNQHVAGVEPATPSVAQERRWLTVLAACGCLVGVDALVVSPLAPQITRAAGTSPHLGGLLVTAYALAYMIVGPIFGPLSDRWGRKRMMVIGLTVFGVGTALTGVGSNFAVLIGFRAVSGLGAAMLVPSILAFVSDRMAPERRGSAIGIIVGAMMGASVLGVPAGAFLAGAVSWRWTFWGIGILSAVLLALIVSQVPETPPAFQLDAGPLAIFARQFRAALENPLVLYTLLSTLLWTVGLQGMFANGGLFYTSNFGLATGYVGLALAGGGAASVFGNIYGGRIADRVGRRRVIAISALVAAASVLTFSLMTRSLLLAILVQVVWGASVGFGQSSLTTLASELSPQARGTVLALNYSAQYGGMMIGTGVAAALLDGGAPFFAVGILCGLSSLLVFPTVTVLMERARSRMAAPVAESPPVS